MKTIRGHWPSFAHAIRYQTHRSTLRHCGKFGRAVLRNSSPWTRPRGQFLSCATKNTPVLRNPTSSRPGSPGIEPASSQHLGMSVVCSLCNDRTQSGPEPHGIPGQIVRKDDGSHGSFPTSTLPHQQHLILLSHILRILETLRFTLRKIGRSASIDI